MARPNKTGLSYFPMDIDLFQDIRIRKLIKYQGGKAVTVYALLLCLIYQRGYYMRWDEELPFIISEQTGFEEAYILEVIRSCMALGLLSKELYDNERIITSKGIQKRYQSICKLLKRRSDITEYSLIDGEKEPIISEETRVISEETKVISEETALNSVKMPQKEKENKKKEISTGVDTKKGKLSLPKTEIIDFTALCDYYNKLFIGKIPVVVKLTEKRKSSVRARATEHGKEAIMQVFQKVLHSPFLLGDNDRGWKCDFDWIFNPNNFVKILEGNYDGESNGSNRNAYTSKQEANAYALNLLQQHKRELEEGMADEMEKPF